MWKRSIISISDLLLKKQVAKLAAGVAITMTTAAVASSYMDIDGKKSNITFSLKRKNYIIPMFEEANCEGESEKKKKQESKPLPALSNDGTQFGTETADFIGIFFQAESAKIINEKLSDMGFKGIENNTDKSKNTGRYAVVHFLPTTEEEKAYDMMYGSEANISIIGIAEDVTNNIRTLIVGDLYAKDHGGEGKFVDITSPKHPVTIPLQHNKAIEAAILAAKLSDENAFQQETVMKPYGEGDSASIVRYTTFIEPFCIKGAVVCNSQHYDFESNECVGCSICRMYHGSPCRSIFSAFEHCYKHTMKDMKIADKSIGDADDEENDAIMDHCKNEIMAVNECTMKEIKYFTSYNDKLQALERSTLDKTDNNSTAKS